MMLLTAKHKMLNVTKFIRKKFMSLSQHISEGSLMW